MRECIFSKRRGEGEGEGEGEASAIIRDIMAGMARLKARNNIYPDISVGNRQERKGTRTGKSGRDSARNKQYEKRKREWR
jgi:hypothetical protein